MLTGLVLLVFFTLATAVPPHVPAEQLAKRPDLALLNSMVPPVGLLKPHEIGLSRVARENNGPLDGFFMIPCFWAGNSDSVPLSGIQTRHYHGDTGLYEIDTTYYKNDSLDCTPIGSELYMKLVYNGQVEYYGDSTVPGATKAALTWTSVLYYFPNDASGQSIADSMNKDCACKGTWKAGVYRNVTSEQCSDAKTPVTNYYCTFVTGQTDYFIYKYTDETHYVTSGDCHTGTSCWDNAQLTTFTREKIVLSGNTNPDNCNYQLWEVCGTNIEEARINCAGCLGLECDGCLFHELNPDWDPSSPTRDFSDWYQCCPCIYKYGQTYKEHEWLQTNC